MSEAQSLEIELLLGELKDVLRLDAGNVDALCRIGGKLAALGREREARRCYRAAVDALQRAAKLGDVQRALDIESAVYAAFVRSGETEENYRSCFADWKDHLATLGRRYRNLDELCSERCERTAFFLHSGPILGHTEVLLKMLEWRPRATGIEPRVYILDRYEPAFLARCRAAGVEVVSALDELGASSPWAARFAFLRRRFGEDGVGACVWVSVPTMAAFALPMRLAPVQIFWALRFHPISGPDIDGHLTWGALNEKTRRYGTQDWEVVALPFAIDDTPPDPSQVAQLRSRFPERFLLGTIAREEKINSVPFLQSVADILLANPQAGYLWTGRTEHAGISGLLRAAGVGDRCHYVGWVDTKVYTAALDVFLESFPYGFGIVGYQAFAAGVPLLSYLDAYTLFGMHYWERVVSRGSEGAPRLDAPDEYPILCARDPREYVALAGRLISDAAWRSEIGARGQRFFRDEMKNSAAYSERFFAAIARVAARGPGAPSPDENGARGQGGS